MTFLMASPAAGTATNPRPSATRRRRRAAVAVTGLTVAALTLAGCSGSGSGHDSASAPTRLTGSGSTPGTTSPAAPAVTISISPAASTPINPKTPVVVSASHGHLVSVHMTNAAGVEVTGDFSSDHSRWSSTEPLGYGKSYQVRASAAGATGATSSKSASLSVIDPSTQAYPSLIPPPGHTDVGVGQPIVVRFDHPVTDRLAAQRAMTVTTSPPQEGAWYWLSNTEVHYRPKVYWKAGTTIHLSIGVYGVDLGNGTYGQTDRQLTIKVHDSWVAKADGKSETMQIFHNGALVKTMPISLGSPGFPSHSGPHVISFKAKSYVMDSSTYGVGPGQPGYYRETVYDDERISNDGEFVHSAPWSVGQQGSSNVSHGCVNLSPTNADWFFNHFGIGDVVEITNSGGPVLPVWDTYGDWTVPWSVWSAGNANG